MMRDFVAAVVIVRTRPRAIPLALVTMKKCVSFAFLCWRETPIGSLRDPGAPLWHLNPHEFIGRHFPFRESAVSVKLVKISHAPMVHCINYHQLLSLLPRSRSKSMMIWKCMIKHELQNVNSGCCLVAVWKEVQKSWLGSYWRHS